ncbi:unnamed protein product [Bursaphelenchus okinawaensis]|uniref:DNA2/NAM7 helicase-like C-terminal domain-containing protein n=1 Tax=Bursaphelenchus okinawaensis TaxID=465554 RepID=A0A811JQU1_9BILA|nr:unnamed protein product [Bursaphelenchus okinawaensis]CAG9078546.1 unnamed protein product [Bursaphelenchus okinawaensis]
MVFSHPYQRRDGRRSLPNQNQGSQLHHSQQRRILKPRSRIVRPNSHAFPAPLYSFSNLPSGNGLNIDRGDRFGGTWGSFDDIMTGQFSTRQDHSYGQYDGRFKRPMLPLKSHSFSHRNQSEDSTNGLLKKINSATRVPLTVYSGGSSFTNEFNGLRMPFDSYDTETSAFDTSYDRAHGSGDLSDGHFKSPSLYGSSTNVSPLAFPNSQRGGRQGNVFTKPQCSALTRRQGEPLPMELDSSPENRTPPNLNTWKPKISWIDGKDSGEILQVNSLRFADTGFETTRPRDHFDMYSSASRRRSASHVGVSKNGVILSSKGMPNRSKWSSESSFDPNPLADYVEDEPPRICAGQNRSSRYSPIRIKPSRTSSVDYRARGARSLNNNSTRAPNFNVEQKPRRQATSDRRSNRPSLPEDRRLSWDYNRNRSKDFGVKSEGPKTPVNKPVPDDRPSRSTRPRITFNSDNKRASYPSGTTRSERPRITFSNNCVVPPDDKSTLHKKRTRSAGNRRSTIDKANTSSNDIKEEGVDSKRLHLYCLNCGNEHEVAECPYDCFRCRCSFKNFEEHKLECQEAMRGFMNKDFERRKVIFYKQRHHDTYPKYSEKFKREYYKKLATLNPKHVDDIVLSGSYKDTMIKRPQSFGNFSGRAMIQAYEYLWKYENILESFELPLFNVKVVKINLTSNGKSRPVSKLTFTMPTVHHGVDDGLRKYFKEKLLHLGRAGFQILLGKREDADSLTENRNDGEWPKDLVRPLVSKFREDVNVYWCNGDVSEDEWTFYTEELVNIIKNPGPIQDGSMYIAFSHQCEPIKKQLENVKKFMEEQKSYLFPRYAASMTTNFYKPLITDHSTDVVLFKEDLEKFNQLMPVPYCLTDTQMEFAKQCYTKDIHAVLGPSGSGKTTIVCFLAAYNWFHLRRRTLIATARPDAAAEITERLLKIADHLKTEHYPHLIKYHVMYKISPTDLMNERSKVVDDVTFYKDDAAENAGIVVMQVRFLMPELLKTFPAQHVLIDEASSMRTVDYYSFLVDLNKQARPLLQYMTLFGDQWQLNPRFCRERFMDDEAERKSGFDESALTQLLKCKISFSQMTQVVRTSISLSKLIQFYYLDLNFDLSNCPEERPMTIDVSHIKNVPPELKSLNTQPFTSIFVNLPATDSTGRYYCRADNMDEESAKTSRKIQYVNKRNINYARMLIDAVMKTNELKKSDCVYLTPYRIQETYFDRNPVKGQTIDRAISTEADFCLVDLVKTKPGGFMNGEKQEWPCYATAKRLLVALSRAKRAQIVIGSVDASKFNAPTTTIEQLAQIHRQSEDPLVRFYDFNCVKMEIEESEPSV